LFSLSINVEYFYGNETRKHGIHSPSQPAMVERRCHAPVYGKQSP